MSCIPVILMEMAGWIFCVTVQQMGHSVTDMDQKYLQVIFFHIDIE